MLFLSVRCLIIRYANLNLQKYLEILTNPTPIIQSAHAHWADYFLVSLATQKGRDVETAIVVALA
ncbi:hypothetical protein GCM10009104_01520 [Marinobacterium maritimum]|uniref:Uncharacterized protein n=1 Tax=Marinobacterium maritimum TaxID=500162 RepID=A0ABN1I1D1_9GAMM